MSAPTQQETLGRVEPRLLTLRQAAAYLGVSYWTFREWAAVGFVAAVNLPALKAREGDRSRTRFRRKLFDRNDLDAFVAARKAGD